MLFLHDSLIVIMKNQFKVSMREWRFDLSVFWYALFRRRNFHSRVVPSLAAFLTRLRNAVFHNPVFQNASLEIQNKKEV